MIQMGCFEGGGWLAGVVVYANGCSQLILILISHSKVVNLC